MKTTNLKIGAAALAAVFFLAACNAANQSSEEKHDSAYHQEESQPAKFSLSEEPKTQNEALNALYPHYLALQDALVNEDMTKAKEAALLIEEASKNIAEANVLQSTASQILAAESIAMQRDAFAPMSNALITLIKSNGVSEGVFYVAHCPMAFNDKGANWVSPSKDIKNPYFGNKMLTCGRVDETLKHL